MAVEADELLDEFRWRELLSGLDGSDRAGSGSWLSVMRPRLAWDWRGRMTGSEMVLPMAAAAKARMPPERWARGRDEVDEVERWCCWRYDGNGAAIGTSEARAGLEEVVEDRDEAAALS